VRGSKEQRQPQSLGSGKRCGSIHDPTGSVSATVCWPPSGSRRYHFRRASRLPLGSYQVVTVLEPRHLPLRRGQAHRLRSTLRPLFAARPAVCPLRLPSGRPLAVYWARSAWFRSGALSTMPSGSATPMAMSRPMTVAGSFEQNASSNRRGGDVLDGPGDGVALISRCAASGR
jgi:hypothetical protein